MTTYRCFICETNYDDLCYCTTLVECNNCFDTWYICGKCVSDELKQSSDEYDFSSIGRYIPNYARLNYVYDPSNLSFYCKQCIYENTITRCPGKEWVCESVLRLTNIAQEIENENIFICQGCHRLLCDDCYYKDGMCLDCDD